MWQLREPTFAANPLKFVAYYMNPVFTIIINVIIITIIIIIII